MGIFDFSWLGSSSTDTQLPDIFPIPILQQDFVAIDVQNIYQRILTDVIERTEGIQEDNKKYLWDNCVKGEKQDGIISLLSKAMINKSELFLVSDVGVIREATQDEKGKIKDDYKKMAESPMGVYITFQNYKKTDMLKFYSALEYCSVGGLYKSSNLSKAIQVKINDLRSSVGLSDSAEAKSQALSIAQGLAQGKDVMIDAKDILSTTSPDLTAINSAINLISAKQSFYLGLPISWITGENKSGLGDSGKADSNSIERGLRPYFLSIVKPVLDNLFKINTSFRSENFDMIQAANETLKTFELTSSDMISQENKIKILNKLFGLPDSEIEKTSKELQDNLKSQDEALVSVALNGAQVASMVQVVGSVNTGIISKESGINIIETAFNIDRALATKIIGSQMKVIKNEQA